MGSEMCIRDSRYIKYMRPAMSPLPSIRIDDPQPWKNVGIDYLGPNLCKHECLGEGTSKGTGPGLASRKSRPRDLPEKPGRDFRDKRSRDFRDLRVFWDKRSNEFQKKNARVGIPKILPAGFTQRAPGGIFVIHGPGISGLFGIFGINGQKNHFCLF